VRASLARLLGRSDDARGPDGSPLIQDIPDDRRDSVASEVLGGVFLGEDGQRYKLIEVAPPDRLTFGRTDR
jgi:hypothetical protein